MPPKKKPTTATKKPKNTKSAKPAPHKPFLTLTDLTKPIDIDEACLRKLRTQSHRGDKLVFSLDTRQVQPEELRSENSQPILRFVRYEEK